MSYHYFALIFLAPVLFLQGLYVKRVTPKLPEPAGDRGGEVGRGRRIRLLVVGDSAAAGVGVAHQSQALSGCLLSQLDADYQIQWRLAAQSGHTTKDCYQALLVFSAQFDVVVISLGVNDVLSPISASRWLTQQQALLSLLRRKFGCKLVLFTRLPPMGQFPALPHPLAWFLGRRAQEFNARMSRWLSSEADCELIDLQRHLAPQHMATDGFHPGAEIYRLWASSGAALIRARIKKPGQAYPAMNVSD